MVKHFLTYCSNRLKLCYSINTKTLMSTTISWLDNLLRLFNTRRGRRFVSRLITSAVVALIVSTLVLYVWIQFFGFRVKDGKLYIGVYESNLSGIVTVDSTSGWQNSGIRLEPGDRVHLEVNGRVHLALNHIYNLAQLAKPLIISDISDQELKSLSFLPTLRQVYPLDGLNRKNVFYRNWTGPEGENYDSDMLNRCKIKPDEGWGALLATVIPEGVKFSGRGDPLDVIHQAGINPSELKPIHGDEGSNLLVGQKGGELAFIINDAVISQNYGAKECQRFHQALLSKARALRNKDYSLDEKSIPLTWFADNVGSFRVVVSRLP